MQSPCPVDLAGSMHTVHALGAAYEIAGVLLKISSERRPAVETSCQRGSCKMVACDLQEIHCHPLHGAGEWRELLVLVETWTCVRFPLQAWQLEAAISKQLKTLFC